jgi:hypothetical protein
MSFRGNIDLSRYVALGDSITSGYTDGALYYEGQRNSFTNLLSQQFKSCCGGEFRQPLLDPASVGMGFNGNSCLVLKEESDNIEPTARSLAHMAESGDAEIFKKNLYRDLGPFNNMGVPGAKIIHLIFSGYANPANGAGNYNPFFTRMTSDPVKASVLSDALKLNPSFFTLFIGNNDAMAYALSGALADSITPLDGAAGIGFKESLLAIVNTLTATGAKGALANLPDISSIPFFTTIPYNGLCLGKAQCAVFNSVYRETGISFHEGKNPFLVKIHQDLLQLQPGDLILMDILLDRNKNAYLNGTYPLPKKYVLFASEVREVEKAIADYNTCIETVAKEKDLAFVNINKLLKRAKKDRFYNKASLNIDYKKKTFFSLDGLHPSALGQTLLANEFIRCINHTYNAEVPLISKEKIKMSLKKG